MQDKEEAVEAPSTTTSLQCHQVSSVKQCNTGPDTSKREGNIDSEAEVKYQTNGSGPEELPTNVWRWDLHHTHTELIPDYSFTLLFSELRRNNECMFASFWSGVMRLLTGNYFLVFILILFTFPLQSCLLSKSFEIKLVYFTVYSYSMSCFAESFKPLIHKSLFT